VIRTELDVQFGLRTEVTMDQSDQGPKWTPTIGITTFVKALCQLFCHLGVS